TASASSTGGGGSIRLRGGGGVSDGSAASSSPGGSAGPTRSSGVSAPTYRGCGNHDLVLYPLRGSGAWLGRALDTSSQAWAAGWWAGLGERPSGAGAPAGPEPVGEVAVAGAEGQLVIDGPDVASSPPRGGGQLGGVAVWFWVENFEAVSTTAEIPGLSATL